MRLRKIMALATLALMAFPSLNMVLGTASLTVGTDSESYEPGEYVEISGTADANATVTIVVINNSTLETIYEDIIEADEDGEFSTRIQLSEDASDGLYNITASTDGVEAETFFVVMTDALDGEETTGTELETDEDEDEVEVEDEEDDEDEDEVEVEDEEDDEDEDEVESEEMGTVEETAEKALGLGVAIERAYAFIDKIEATAQRLNENGFQVTEMLATLDEARPYLEGAESYLLPDSFDLEASAQELAKARGILGRTMGLLQSAARKHNEDRAVGFLGQVQNRIQGLNMAISRLQERLGADETGRALGALGAAEMRLQQIRDRLAGGDVDGAVDELDDVVDDIDEGLDELNGEGVSAMLKAMNRVEARIRVLKATLERLARKGGDTSQIEEELESAEALLSQMKDQLTEISTDEAEELLEEAEGYLEGAGERIRDIVRPSWVRKGPPDWSSGE